MEDEAMLTALEPADKNPNSAANKSPNPDLPDNPPNTREEGELSSDEEDDNTTCSAPDSTRISVPPSGAMLVPPMNKFTQAIQAGKAICGNDPATSANIQSQTSILSTSQKINDKKRIPLKSIRRGWPAPPSVKGDLVISFSDDESHSDSEEKECRKEKTKKTHVTGVVANGKPPKPTRKVDRVMAKKFSVNHNFNSSMTKIPEVRDSGLSSVHQGSRVRNFNSNKKSVSQERGYVQGVGSKVEELHDLRQKIAYMESKIYPPLRTKESIACRDDNAVSLHRDGATKAGARYSDVAQIEPKEPDKKRMKVGGSLSTQLSAIGPQDIPVVKSILSSGVPAGEDNSLPDPIKNGQGQKGIPIGSTDSGIVKWKNQNDKHVAGISENISVVKDVSGINAKCIQSDGRKLVDPYVILNQGTAPENMTCNNLPENSNTVELNNKNANVGHLEPDSFLNKSTPGKNLVRSTGQQDVISSDKKLDPSFYNICQASLNNASFWNCLGNPNVTRPSDIDIHSLVEMEETLDKDLEEAQEHRRRCEIEERNALKAYRKAQRDLLQANSRCSDLYRKREVHSANLRVLIMDDPNLTLSSRQSEQAGIRLDHANNMSENVNLIPTSSHQMHHVYNDLNLAACDSNIPFVNSAGIHTSYKHLSGQIMGSEACIDPDASTSEPVPLLGADGVYSPSHEPHNLANENEDEDRFSFENESVQPNLVCHKSRDFEDKQTDIDEESNRKFSIDSSQDPVILERMLRSKLFAKLGTKPLSKNSSSCNNTELAVERGAENDVRSAKSSEIKGGFPNSEVEKSHQSDHEGIDGREKSSSEAPLEIQRENSVENLSVTSHSNSHFEDTFYFGDNILRGAFGYMKILCPKNLVEPQASSQPSPTPTCMNSEKIQFSSAMVEPLKESLVKLSGREMGSYCAAPAVDPFWPLCMFELRGKCNNDECPWQHVRDYSNTNNQHQHDNSGGADCQVGLTLDRVKCDSSTRVPGSLNFTTSPTYLVGLDILKADLHPYQAVLARRNCQSGKKCFSLFLVLSNLFRKDIPADGPFSHGNGGQIEVPPSNRQSSYFQSFNGGVNQLTQALADNDQSLETALSIFVQEANELEGLTKALPVLSRALEADPTSINLWIFYLLIYYSNMKSLGKDDMFSCAVKYNDRSYELWLMCINSRNQLDDRLVQYDAALSALCRHAPASDIDGIYASACILDLFLQMMDCLCMSGNTAKAIQKIFGLFSTAMNFDEPKSLSLSDILTCLSISDKCIFGVCCVYLVIYRKLPNAVVRQFECQKELFEIEWPSIQLPDDEKQKAIMLMESVVDSVDMKIESLEKSEFNIRLTHSLAINHLRCMAALDSLERCRNLLDKYLTLYPSCLELVLISARAHKHDLGYMLFESFEEALGNWPKEVPGIQCIWNQYVEYVLQNGRFDFAKEVMDRWFHSDWKVNHLQNDTLDEMDCDNADGSLGLNSDSIQQTPSSNPKQMDRMFGYLNLSLHKLFLNDYTEARLALDMALDVAIPEYFRHCLREHALFIITDDLLSDENVGVSGVQKILERYLVKAEAFSTPDPLSRKFIDNIKKPRLRQLVSNAFIPLSSDFSVVNSVLEAWYGPSLLPEKFNEQKYLVDFFEAILDITPSNYVLAISVCKLLSSGSNASEINSLSYLLWASSNLVSAIFHAVPIPPEYVWVEAAEVLGNIAGVEVISERFYERALCVYPFSLKLWKSHLLSMLATGNADTVVEAARGKGIQLG